MVHIQYNSEGKILGACDPDEYMSIEITNEEFAALTMDASSFRVDPQTKTFYRVADVKQIPAALDPRLVEQAIRDLDTNLYVPELDMHFATGGVLGQSLMIALTSMLGSSGDVSVSVLGLKDGVPAVASLNSENVQYVYSAYIDHCNLSMEPLTNDQAN